MTSFDPRMKGKFAEMRRRKSGFFVLGLWRIPIRLSPYKIGDVLLNDFEHRPYLSFIVGVIDSVIDSSFLLLIMKKKQEGINYGE